MSQRTIHLPRLRTVTAFFLLIAMVGALAISASADAKRHKPAKGPAGLKFYKAPKKKIAKRHGKLIWQRNAKSVVRLKSARLTKLVLYSSRSTSGKKVAVSGSVSIPKGRKPRGGWPVITYGHGTTGIADKCAPSRNRPGGPATDYINYTDDEQNSWLKAGYAVLRTDYQGLGTPGIHPFLIGQAEGRSMLDIVRAARGLKKGLISKRYLIAGHSQGGHASLFAAGLAASWVPDLKLKGTVAYAPASHMKEQADLLPALTDPSSLTALAALIVKGAESVSGTIVPEQLLSDPVLAYYPQTETECLPQLGRPDNLGGIAPADLARPGTDLTPLLDLLGQQNPAVVSQAPILMAQGLDDTTTFPFLSVRLQKELEVAGNDLTYTEYPGVDHGGILDAAHDEAMNFFESHLPTNR